MCAQIALDKYIFLPQRNAGSVGQCHFSMPLRVTDTKELAEMWDLSEDRYGIQK